MAHHSTGCRRRHFPHHPPLLFTSHPLLGATLPSGSFHSPPSPSLLTPDCIKVSAQSWPRQRSGSGTRASLWRPHHLGLLPGPALLQEGQATPPMPKALTTPARAACVLAPPLHLQLPSAKHLMCTAARCRLAKTLKSPSHHGPFSPCESLLSLTHFPTLRGPAPAKLPPSPLAASTLRARLAPTAYRFCTQPVVKVEVGECLILWH